MLITANIQSGLKDLYPLLQSIPAENVIPPGLHHVLGFVSVNDIVSHLFEKIKSFEQQNEAISTAASVLRNAECELNLTKKQITDLQLNRPVNPTEELAAEYKQPNNVLPNLPTRKNAE